MIFDISGMTEACTGFQKFHKNPALDNNPVRQIFTQMFLLDV